jgi:hypothetical protein
MPLAKNTSLRLPADTIVRLKRLARRRSFYADRDLTWGEVGRELLEQALLGEDERDEPRGDR